MYISIGIGAVEVQPGGAARCCLVVERPGSGMGREEGGGWCPKWESLGPAAPPVLGYFEAGSGRAGEGEPCQPGDIPGRHQTRPPAHLWRGVGGVEDGGGGMLLTPYPGAKGATPQHQSPVEGLLGGGMERSPLPGD